MPDIYGYNNTKINIIMFNMSSFYDWDHGIVNRNYNILNALAKEDKIGKIVGVDFLPTTARKAAAHYLKNILWEIKTSEMVYGDLTSACYQRSDKIYAYSTIDSLFSFKYVARQLKRIEKILNLKNIVFWSYNPMFTEFIGKLNEKLFVFDTVDNWTEHPTYPQMQSLKRLKKNYKKIAEKADLIFTVSEELKDFYKSMDRTKEVHWVPNGVDYDHFNDPEKIELDNELSKFDKPIIGYLGTIEDRIDLDLIAKVAKQHKDKIVAICGPVWPLIKKLYHEKLGKLDNVHSLGRIKFEEAPSYVNKFNVAIIPHKDNKLVQSMNPMKMYDYLACGRPTVATKGAGIEMFKNEIYIAKDHNDFVGLIDKALEEDSPEKRTIRRNVVKKHSWKARADIMTNLLYKKLNL
jgi:teichuronic acid biosynthesis glycosyltransferase TuaH